MKKLPKTAYELEPTKAQLSTEQQREAILWWQNHTPYTPLRCPVCRETLKLAQEQIRLECPQTWCHYQTDEIPWGVYTAWLSRG